MVQIIDRHGVVDGIRRMRHGETSGWTDLFLNDLLGFSVEATIVESLEFRTLFHLEEIAEMEDVLKRSGYQPQPPR